MGEYEDTVQSLRDKGLDDEADTLEKFGASQLRKKAERTDELEKENAKLTATNRTLVVAPKKDAALRAAGVDLESLRPADKLVLAGLEFEGDEPSEDWVAKTIADLQLPITGQQQQEGSGPPNAAAVVDAAQGAPAGGGGNGVITPEDVAGWTTQQAAKFSMDHPDAWEQLKRGKEVTGVTTS